MGCGASTPSKAELELENDAPPEGKSGAGTAQGAADPEPKAQNTVIDATEQGPENALSLFSQNFAGTTELIVAQCQLTELPNEVGLLSSLVKLDLSSNKLTALPASIGRLTKLEVLDANDNSLKTLPAEFGQLTSLTNLLLYKNAISSLPETFGNLAELTELNLFNNKILKLPPCIGKLSKLEEVNLSANKVMKVEPAALESWSDVSILNLFDCRVLMLADLGHLEGLEELRLFGNNLNAMPSFGTGLSKLRILELHRNNITEIPADFFPSMELLNKLTLSNNALTSLPAEIAKGKLETLVCDDNKLTELPLELASLSTLRVLLINGNQITTVGQEWKTNTAITRINLTGNPINGCSDVLTHLKATCDSNNGMFWSP